MSEPVERNFAWEPLTPRGVAAFAHAKFNRLFLVQFIFALLAAAVVVWFLYDGCFPIINTAIQNLPDDGEISSGKLNWQGDSSQSLADGRFLAFDVDLNHSGQIRSTKADFQVEFGRETIRVFSLFGYADFIYPENSMSFNRPELEAFFGAWKMEILIAAAIAVVIGLFLIWAVLATVYLSPVWIWGFFINRDLNLVAAWKLSGAALMPGALLLTVVIFAYTYGFIGLIPLGFVFGAHLILGWIYLPLSCAFAPRIAEPKQKRNPFGRPKKRE
ncbi:MAG TPA: hypothetical protein VHG89_08595 [Verrucomicrobiae bacterium]|nr:hypothetical protein [Verrucomicrobiae bacterium]